MKKFILIFALTAICNLSCMAQNVSEAYEAEIERHFNLASPDKMFKDTFVQQFGQFVGNGTMSENQVMAIADELVEVMLPEMKRITRDFLTANFNIDELKQINDFYATPTGQKMMQLMPNMTTELQKTMTKPEFMEKMMQIFSKFE